MKITLLRHTTPFIPKGICYGQLDVDVAPTFEEEFQLVFSQLGKEKFDVVYASPLIRCAVLAHKFSDEVVLDQRLLEVDFGHWENVAWDDIPKHEIDPWMKDWIEVAPPKGENLVEMHKRVFYFIEELKKSQSTNVLIVTHHGVMRLFDVILNHKNLDQLFDNTWKYGHFVTFMVSV